MIFRNGRKDYVIQMADIPPVPGGDLIVFKCDNLFGCLKMEF